MNKKQRITTLLAFLLGIFMGAIDSGIVSPARTVINHSFKVDPSIGVWMITIYTLSYAVSMPISSKLSDRYGRKKMYIISIIIFTSGSALCGLNNFFGTYSLFLVSRVIQAIGGGGIVPIATAFIGQSFPEEKRGTALGFVGAIYGIATILGPTLGSTVLSIAGNDNWGFLFFINIPISIIILFLSFNLKENKAENVNKIDLTGILVISIVILSLMYSLTNLNFFNFTNSIKNNKVWPYLLIFLLLLPVFVLTESKAKDPIMNLKYFKEKKIFLTLMVSFIVGLGLMGVVFVPQFAENALKLKSGSGGYLVTLMAVFAGIGAPIGGKLIDKYSAKLVLCIGFSNTIIGTLFLALYTTKHPGFIPVFIGLMFIGLGMGFTMGTPLNYLMLSYVNKDESASALSTLSLMRSIGVTISPNIMINFITEASKKLPELLKSNLPPVSMPKVPGMPSNIPGMPSNLSSMSSGTLPKGMLEMFQNADVTTIVSVMKKFSGTMFDSMIPKIKSMMMSMLGSMKAVPGIPDLKNIDLTPYLNSWKTTYMIQIENKRHVLEKLFQDTLNTGFKNMFMAAATIAFVGLLITLLLPSKKVSS